MAHDRDDRGDEEEREGAARLAVRLSGGRVHDGRGEGQERGLDRVERPQEGQEPTPSRSAGTRRGAVPWRLPRPEAAASGPSRAHDRDEVRLRLQQEDEHGDVSPSAVQPPIESPAAVGADAERGRQAASVE